MGLKMTERQASKAAWDYMTAYGEQYGVVDTDTLFAIYKSHMAYLLNSEQMEGTKMELNEFTTEYNSICEKHLKVGSTLKDLSDHDLYIWIAGQTYRFGRSLEDSLMNAQIHLEDREKAVQKFSFK